MGCRRYNTDPLRPHLSLFHVVGVPCLKDSDGKLPQKWQKQTTKKDFYFRKRILQIDIMHLNINFQEFSLYAIVERGGFYVAQCEPSPFKPELLRNGSLYLGVLKDHFRSITPLLFQSNSSVTRKH